ncbi:hypothetical protein ACFL1X_10860 [Candidatus Hydrogenedentota bacterium]
MSFSRRHMFSIFAAIMVAMFAMALVTTAEETEAEARPCFSGRFTAELDALWSDDTGDLNLDQSLQFKISPPDWERVRFKGYLWAHEDIDSSDDRRYSVLRDINDASRSDVNLRVLSLYMEVDDVWGDSILRIGRQRIFEGAAKNRIDGVYFKKREGNWDWYAFGGVRASIYENTNDDRVVGAGASFRISDKTKLAVDGYYGEERRSRGDVVNRLYFGRMGREYLREVDRKLRDNLIQVSLWHILTPNVQLFGRFSRHDGQSDELLLSATGYVPDCGVEYELSYRRLLNTVGDRTDDLGGSYRVLGDYNDYHNLLMALHKPLNDVFTLSLEAEFRDGSDDDWPGSNRDNDRYAAILSGDEILPGVDASVSAERWDSSGQEDSWVFTGECAKDWGSFELTLGADYERYKERYEEYYPSAAVSALELLRPILVPGTAPRRFRPGTLPNITVVERHEDVRSFYMNTKWSFTKKQDLTTKVSYETDDGPESPYWRMQVGYSIRF